MVLAMGAGFTNKEVVSMTTIRIGKARLIPGQIALPNRHDFAWEALKKAVARGGYFGVEVSNPEVRSYAAPVVDKVGRVTLNGMVVSF